MKFYLSDGRIKMTKGINLIVNGERISTNKFVNSVLHDVLIAILQNLRGLEDIDNITQIEISY